MLLLRIRNAFTSSVFEPPQWVSTQTLVLQHNDRRQGLSLRAWGVLLDPSEPRSLSLRAQRPKVSLEPLRGFMPILAP